MRDEIIKRAKNLFMYCGAALFAISNVDLGAVGLLDPFSGEPAI